MLRVGLYVKKGEKDFEIARDLGMFDIDGELTPFLVEALKQVSSKFVKEGMLKADCANAL